MPFDPKHSLSSSQHPFPLLLIYHSPSEQPFAPFALSESVSQHSGREPEHFVRESEHSPEENTSYEQENEHWLTASLTSFGVREVGNEANLTSRTLNLTW